MSSRSITRREAGEAGEGSLRGHLDGPQAVAAIIEASLDALDQGGALGEGQRRGEVLHDGRVGVHRGERLEVRGPPAPQQQPLGPQLRPRAHAPQS